MADREKIYAMLESYAEKMEFALREILQDNRTPEETKTKIRTLIGD